MTGKSAMRQTIKEMFFAKKERPILFSTEMVKAILAKLKTMTRRAKGLEVINQNPDDWQFEWADFCLDKPWRFTQKSSINDQSLKDRSFHQEAITCPYGKTGDILWVRENLFQNGELGLEYSANHEPIDESIIPQVYGPYGGSYSFRGIPSIHMPKWAARIWLEITDIRVERLQSISNEDAKAEGAPDALKVSDMELLKGLGSWPIPRPFNHYQFGFLSVWCKINGCESWLANPWVWVISFKVLSTTGKPAELGKEVANA